MRKRNIFIACASIIAALSLTCVQLRAQTLSQTTVSNVTEQATLAGTATKNDLLTITIYDVGLSGGQKSVSTAVISGSDTLKKMATRLADGINADTALQAIGVSAIANENVLTIKSFSPNSTSYTAGVSNGATETISLAAHANPVENAVISGTPKATNRLTIRVFDSGLPTGQHPVDYIVQSGDTLQSIATSLATTNNNTGVLKSLGITATTAANVVTIKSYSPNQTTYTQSVTGNTPTETITLSTNQNSINDLVLSGPVVGGTNLTFGVQDVGLAGGQQAVAYTVQPNDTLASVSCGLASAVNTNANLAALGVRATCGGSNFLTVQSDSINQTNLLLVGPSVFCAPITIINSQPLMDDVKLCGTASVQSAQIVRSTLESIYGASAGLLDAAATLRLQAPKWYVYHDHPQYGLSGDSLFSHTGGPPRCAFRTLSRALVPGP